MIGVDIVHTTILFPLHTHTMSTSNHNKPLRSRFIVASCIAAITIGSFIGKSVEANITLFFQGFIQNLAPQTFPVNFNVAGNQYVGSLVITEVEVLTTPQTVTFWGLVSLTCQRKIKWYYFNVARWLRARPLDATNLTSLQNSNASYSTLTMNGGLYTACNNNPQDIVWYISYADGAVAQWTILFGVTMTPATNSYTTTYSSWSFIIESYTKPIGYMYDTLVGIGYVDGNASTAGGGGWWWWIANTFWHLAVQWRLELGKVVNDVERTAIKGNIGKKSLIYNTDEITSSTIINLAAKNAKVYCRGGNTYNDITIAIASDKSQAICIDASVLTTPITIDSSNIWRIQWKDIIVQNRNVFIDKTIYAWNQRISLFVNKWNLILATNMQTSDLKSFDGNWFITTAGTITKWISLRGNYIVNGLVLGADTPTGILKPIEAKTFIQGKLASLNLPTISNSQREKQIINAVWWLPSNTGYINLENLFSRRCNINFTGGWVGYTGTSNPTIGPAIPCNNTGDNHYDRSLIVIEKDFPSVLFKK